MKDKRSLHLKLQELCDCYATTDPLKEMSDLTEDEDMAEAPLKWLALAALHGVNASAEKISISRAPDGRVSVTVKYRKTELPSPGREIGEEILRAAREITHIEGEKGKTLLALGIRDSSLDIGLKLKQKEGGETLTLTFPE